MRIRTRQHQLAHAFGASVRQLLRDRPAMRISQNGGWSESRFHHDDVQVGGERGDIVRAAELAALPMAAKVGDQHAKVVVQKLDERIEHGAGDHEPVQQKQGFAVAHDFVEDSVRCAAFPGAG